jgi:hypothetical protein
MNIIAFIILAALLLELVLNLTADFLNLKMLREDLPAEFKDVYDKNRYQKSQAYLRVNTKFGWTKMMFNLFVLLVFWFGKGFSALDIWIQSFQKGPVDFFVGLLLRKLSRINEYQADEYSVTTTRNPAAMVAALKKLSAHNLSNLVPHPFYAFLNYAHPPLLKRIEAIERAPGIHAKSHD